MLNPSIISLAFGLACTQCYAQVPVCTVTPNKATLAPNEILILTASCAPAATSFVWTGLGIPSMTAVPSVLATAPLTGSYVYTVTGVNASGQSQVSSTTITVGGAAVVTPPSPPITVIPDQPAMGPASLPACASTYVEPGNLTKADIALTGDPVNATLVSGKIFAWKFVAKPGLVVARVEMTSDSFIDGKDVTISSCAGEFSGKLPNECSSALMGSTMLMLDSDSTFAQRRCHLVSGSSYYINVKMSYPTTGSIVTIKAREFR